MKTKHPIGSLYRFPESGFLYLKDWGLFANAPFGNEGILFTGGLKDTGGNWWSPDEIFYTHKFWQEWQDIAPAEACVPADVIEVAQHQWKVQKQFESGNDGWLQ